MELTGEAVPAEASRALLVERLAAPGAGLLLDLDGTLVDSEPIHRAAFAEYFAGRGWDVPDEVVRRFMGRRATEVFPVLDGPWRGEDPARLTEEVIAVLRRSRERPVPVPGAERTLALAAERGVPVAVVTSARAEWAHGVLDALSLPERPPLVTAEDCTAGKPDPEPYRRGAELLGLDPAGLVAVEDAAAGLVSARGAGVGLLVALTTSAPAATLTEADVVLPDLRDLAVALEGRRAP